MNPDQPDPIHWSLQRFLLPHRGWNTCLNVTTAERKSSGTYRAMLLCTRHAGNPERRLCLQLPLARVVVS